MDCCRSFSRKTRTWSQFTGVEKRLLFRALALLPLVAISLTVLGLRRTQSWLARGPAPLSPPAIEALRDEVMRAARMVQVARRYHSLWANCLAHAVTLWALLRRQGIDSDLRIGVRNDHQRRQRFEAHAWLEWKGEVLTDTEDVRQRYHAFKPRINME